MCTITTDPNAEGEIVGGDLVLIRVRGTSTDCGQIEVTIRCGSGAPLSKTATIDFASTPNTWVAEFTDPAELEDSRCLCGGSLEISTECAENPDCFAEPVTTPLKCVGECPKVTIDHSVSENCVDGKREVTLTATNLGPGNPKAQWEVEPGVFVPGVPFTLPAPGGTDTKTHLYFPGPHTAILHIVDIENCPDQSIEIKVSECPPCPTVDLDETRFNCTDSGTQPMQFKATLTGPVGTTISARLKEGAIVFDQGESDTGILELDSSKIDFAPGSHKITVEIISPAGCKPYSTTVEVDCEPKGACCLPDGSCEELTEEECQERGGVYSADGTSCADVECGDGNGNGDDGCAWYNPLCWSICAWLGGVLANAIIAYLVLIATGADPGISAVLANIPGFPTIELNTLYGVLGGLLSVAATTYAYFCGLCNLAKATVAGAAAGIVVIVVALIFGGSLPNWPEAVFTAVIMGVSGVAGIRAACD